MNTFKKIAAVSMAAVTLATTMMSASAYTVTSKHVNVEGLDKPVFTWDNYGRYYDIQSSVLSKYAMLTKSFLASNIDLSYRNTEWVSTLDLWLNYSIVRGEIICTFEKGMTLNEVFEYSRHIYVEDEDGYVATELIYDVDTGVYALRAFREDKNFIDVDDRSVPFSWNGYYDKDKNPDTNPTYVTAKSDNCFPTLWVYNKNSGSVVKPQLFANDKLEGSNIRTYTMVWDVPESARSYHNAAMLVGSSAPLPRAYEKPVIIPPKVTERECPYIIVSTAGDTVEVKLKKSAVRDTERSVVLDNTTDDINLIRTYVYHDLYYADKLTGKTYIKVRWDDNSSQNLYVINNLK